MRKMRIGAQIGPYDPFWVQVREAIYKKIHLLDLDLIPIELAKNPEDFSLEEQSNILDDLLTQDLDALICWNFPSNLIFQLLDHGLPTVYLSETAIRHPLFVSPVGLYEAGRLVGAYFAEQLHGRGQVLCVGGLIEHGGENGSSRINGFSDALRAYPNILMRHYPSYWRFAQAYPQIKAAIQDYGQPVDGIFALSDPLALATRDVVAELGIDRPMLIAGVNGDPEALVAISDGSLSATVETSPTEFGTRAVEMAYQAAQKLPLPDHFDYKPALITRANVNEAITRKMLSIADLPNRLVGLNQKLEQDRVTQLEISTTINKYIGSFLDRHKLSLEISNLIREYYAYDHVELFWYSKEAQRLTLEPSGERPDAEFTISKDQPNVLTEALINDGPVFIPDLQHSTRFPPDPRWPKTHSRVVLPIHLGSDILGLMDLHCDQNVFHSRQELIGLQLLADYLGVAIRNAELYTEAVKARAVAEKADQLKTRMLANVGHELRTPLNVIMGFSQAAIETPNIYHTDLPAEMIQDQKHIYRSGEHLKRLINDLLDLSRAEIEELDLYPETISTRPFLEEVFNSMVPAAPGAVAWNLALPDRLPVIQADPVRLRQIILNLLSNAAKFTKRGSIVLGVETVPPHIHLWVQDTGPGIPLDLQEQIFEPFVTIEQSGKRSEGIGLGLSITRRLVALHGGTMSLESRPDVGSTFHVYLPLPSLAGWKDRTVIEQVDPVLLVLSPSAIPPAIAELARQQNLSICQVGSLEQLNQILTEKRPCALAWDLTNSEPQDWRLVEAIRSHPDYCHLPFIFYNQNENDGSGLTNVLAKPILGKTLVEYIQSLHPESAPVLVVDDDPEMCILYQRLVKDALPGAEVFTAKDGAVALEMLSEITPGLIILDLVMPEVNGFTVLEQVRLNPKTRQVPVLVMSGKLLSYEDVQKLDYARVVFYNKAMLSPEEAIACIQKTMQSDEVLPQPTSNLVKQVIAYLHQNYAQSFSRQQIADAVKVSESYLTRIFKQELNMTPWDCLTRIRIAKAKELLTQTSDSITTIAFKVGFDDSAYFSRVFRKYTNESPQSFRNDQG